MTYRLAIIDDSIPNAFPSSFRNYEFNLILNALQKAYELGKRLATMKL